MMIMIVVVILEIIMYKAVVEKLVPASLSNSYSELEIISISASGFSSCSILHFLPITSTTNYYPKEI